MLTTNKHLLKIVIIGPESTGKSKLSSFLAKKFNTTWVPEYARTYIDRLKRPYTETDLLTIAEGQLQNEDYQTKHACNGILFCDTDLNVIKVWSKHAFNSCHPWIVEQIDKRHYDFYLLCNTDLPWEFDVQREHPSETMRMHFFKKYKNIVEASGVPWAIVKGNGNIRYQNAYQHVNNFLKSINHPLYTSYTF